VVGLNGGENVTAHHDINYSSVIEKDMKMKIEIGVKNISVCFPDL